MDQCNRRLKSYVSIPFQLTQETHLMAQWSKPGASLPRQQPQQQQSSQPQQQSLLQPPQQRLTRDFGGDRRTDAGFRGRGGTGRGIGGSNPHDPATYLHVRRNRIFTVFLYLHFFVRKKYQILTSYHLATNAHSSKN